MYRCIVNLTLCMKIIFMYLANILDFNRIRIYNHLVSVHPSLHNSQGGVQHKSNISYIHHSISAVGGRLEDIYRQDSLYDVSA